jgi:hypothetical protein
MLICRFLLIGCEVIIIKLKGIYQQNKGSNKINMS